MTARRHPARTLSETGTARAFVRNPPRHAARPAPRALAVLAALLLGACAATPGAIRALDAMKDQDARGDWRGLAAATLSECDGPGDSVCAERHALRARGCARLAAAPDLSETDRSAWRDCAVASGRAALDAAAATGAAERTAWRDAYADALFARRQAVPGSRACADNTALRAEADLLRAARPDAARPRFLAASARLTAVARGCTPDPAPCATLAAARALLDHPPPEAATHWQALAAGIAATARRLACPT